MSDTWQFEEGQGVRSTVTDRYGSIKHRLMDVDKGERFYCIGFGHSSMWTAARLAEDEWEVAERA